MAIAMACSRPPEPTSKTFMLWWVSHFPIKSYADRDTDKY
jgi:hypothetical protein